jgi:chromosome condensin MukBEF ATPase and DNA-binding subunit MukB
MNVNISDSEKQLKQRLVELQQQRDNARQAVEAARDDLINGKGKTDTLTAKQAGYSAICEAVAELERRIMAAERQRDEQRRQAERDELQARLKVLCDDDASDERAIAATVERVYSQLDSELSQVADHYFRSNERQAEIARVRAALGQTVDPFPTHSVDRIARLSALFESDERRTRLFAGVRGMLNDFLFDRSRQA